MEYPQPQAGHLVKSVKSVEQVGQTGGDLAVDQPCYGLPTLRHQLPMMPVLPAQRLIAPRSTNSMLLVCSTFTRTWAKALL